MRRVNGLRAGPSRIGRGLWAGLAGLLLAAAVASGQEPILQARLFYPTPMGDSGGLETDPGEIDPPLGLPASYSLVPTYVTSVKNQGSCGSCWAFATYGSMESHLLKSGQGTANLSENHLKNYHGFDWGPCDGGNAYISMAYLSRLAGPVAEADDPYHPYDDRPSPGGPRQYFLSRCLWFDTAAEMKSALMDHGALYTSMYWDAGSYDSGTYTYFYNANPNVDLNHAVTIVGWDDAKTVSGTPKAGAWLIKNSWGTGWGDSGYFWISYEDKVACPKAYSFQAAPADTVERVYYHDYFGDVTEVDSSYALNVFQTTQEEWLKSVGFYIQKDGAGFTLRIYNTMTGGAPAGLLAEKAGTLQAGFHVVDLDSLLYLSALDDFVIYLHLTNGGTYPHAIDRARTDYSSTSTAAAGQSYYSFNGTTWTDLYTWQDGTANFAIKAYTVPEPATLAFLVFGGLLGLVCRRRGRVPSPPRAPAPAVPRR